MIEQDIQTYLDTATFALNRAIGLALSRAESLDDTFGQATYFRVLARSLQESRDITVAVHKQLDSPVGPE